MTEQEVPRLRAGDRLAHYRLEEAVGEGAMGIVYRAHDTSLDRTVGLKVLRPEVSSNERFVKRFVREARAAARVTHPNLTHIYFVGEQDGRHFFAMEFVEGQDLEETVKASGPLDVDRALDALIQTAEGLGAAHASGVMHRDVKPSNLLLQPDGRVRITDFGVAKSLDADVDASQAGTMIGTPTYMSPEQCRGRSVDHRSDIYALGLTAYFLLTGRKAFPGEALGEVIDRQLNADLPRLARDGEDLPEEVDAVVRRMCAKDPEHRYADMDAAARALAACRSRPVPPAPLATRTMAAVVDLIPPVGLELLVEGATARLLGRTDVVHTLFGTIILSVLFVVYHVGCEVRWGQTLGKWMFGIGVTSVRGRKPRLGALFLRFVVRYPFAILAVPVALLPWPRLALVMASVQLVAIGGAFVTYLVTRGRTLSDLLTSTRVTPVGLYETSSSTQ